MSEGVRLGVSAAALIVGAACAAIALATDRRGTEMSRRGTWLFVAAATLLVSCVPLEALNATGRLPTLGLVGVAGVLAGALSLTVLGHRLAHRAASMSCHVRLTYAGSASVGGLRGRVPAGVIPTEPRPAHVFVSTVDDRFCIELNQN
jgi:hypothetical protein